MSRYVITKCVEGVDGIEGSDLLTNVVFKDRISAIAYVRMYVEKSNYQITLGEFDFPITGNIEINTRGTNWKHEIYQLVELADEGSETERKAHEEAESWALSALRTKMNS